MKQLKRPQTSLTTKQASKSKKVADDVLVMDRTDPLYTDKGKIKYDPYAWSSISTAETVPELSFSLENEDVKSLLFDVLDETWIEPEEILNFFKEKLMRSESVAVNACVRMRSRFIY